MSTSSLSQGGYLRSPTEMGDRKSKIENRECPNGFTILEILLTIVIMSIALVPLMQMLPATLLLDARMERETKIAFLAQQKLEGIKSKAIHDFSQDYTESATAFPSPDSAFKYIVSDDQGAQLKDITVIVWYDKDSDNNVDEDEEEIELDTRIARRD